MYVLLVSNYPGCCFAVPWWRHQMETFSALLALCAGNSLVTGEFPAQRPGTRNFGVLFDLHLNKRLNKQPRGWWFEMPSRPLWRHFNAITRPQAWYILQRDRLLDEGLTFVEAFPRVWSRDAPLMHEFQMKIHDANNGLNFRNLKCVSSECDKKYPEITSQCIQSD